MIMIDRRGILIEEMTAETAVHHRHLCTTAGDATLMIMTGTVRGTADIMTETVKIGMTETVKIGTTEIAEVMIMIMNAVAMVIQTTIHTAGEDMMTTEIPDDTKMTIGDIVARDVNVTTMTMTEIEVIPGTIIMRIATLLLHLGIGDMTANPDTMMMRSGGETRDINLIINLQFGFSPH